MVPPKPRAAVCVPASPKKLVPVGRAPPLDHAAGVVVVVPNVNSSVAVTFGGPPHIKKDVFVVYHGSE